MLAVLASKGYDVIGIDTDPETVDKFKNHITSGRRAAPPGTSDREQKPYFPDHKLEQGFAEADITMIIIPTPRGADGGFRNDYVLSAVDEIGRAAYSSVVIIATIAIWSPADFAERQLR